MFSFSIWYLTVISVSGMKNKVLNLGLIIELLIACIVCYAPGFSTFFKTYPLRLHWYAYFLILYRWWKSFAQFIMFRQRQTEVIFLMTGKNLFGSPIPEASVPIVEMQVAEILCVLSVHRFVFSSVLHALFGGRLGSLDFEIFAWAKSKRVSSLIRGETNSLFLIICNNMYLYINCFVFRWFLALPFCILMFVFDEFRKYCIRNKLFNEFYNDLTYY